MPSFGEWVPRSSEIILVNGRAVVQKFSIVVPPNGQHHNQPKHRAERSAALPVAVDWFAPRSRFSRCAESGKAAAVTTGARLHLGMKRRSRPERKRKLGSQFQWLSNTISQGIATHEAPRCRERSVRSRCARHEPMIPNHRPAKAMTTGAHCFT